MASQVVNEIFRPTPAWPPAQMETVHELQRLDSAFSPSQVVAVRPTPAWPPAQNTMDAVHELQRLDSVISLLIAGRSDECTFERSYRTVYNLVLWKHGAEAYSLVRQHLSRASLRLRKLEYDRAVPKLQAVAHYMCKTFCLSHDLPDITTLAAQLYQRPAARAWRSLIRLAWWAGLIVRCRRAFDEVRLRPGGSGALACADHFRATIAVGFDA